MKVNVLFSIACVDKSSAGPSVDKDCEDGMQCDLPEGISSVQHFFKDDAFGGSVLGSQGE
jgi:hypothetical protein